jgi:cysteinyl-tRNA synthetase
LGDGFDIHGGGQDLAFPHHENERAQAVAIGRRFARHWVHNGFVEVAGEKMSKSLGNFTNLMDLVEASDPRAYRLLVLRAHYRSPVDVNKATTDDASKALASLDAFARRSASWPDVAPDAEALDAFRAAMDDDLDTPRVVAQLFTLVRRANQLADAGDVDAAAPLAAAVREIAGAVGLELHADVEEAPDHVLALAAARDRARAAKDWSEADRLRDEIQAAGFLVEDTADGTVVRPS